MEHEGALLWTAPWADGRSGAAGIARAERAVDRAAELLGTAAPEEWRGAAAQAFRQRVSALVSDCLRLRGEVSEAARASRLLQAELVAARSELAAVTGLWPWPWGREPAA